MKSAKPYSIFIPSFLFFILLSGLVFGMYLLSQNQDIRQQASIGLNDSQDACITEDCNEIVSNQTDPSKFISSEGRYRISIDSYLWKQSEVPLTASKTDRETAFFVLRNSFAFATIYTASHDYPESFLSDNGVFNGDIEGLTKSLESQVKRATSTGRGMRSRFLESEIVMLGETQAIRLKYVQEFGKDETPYDEYLLLGKNHYIEAETRFIESGDSEQAALAFLSQIEIDEALVLGAETELSSQAKLIEVVKPSVVQVVHLFCKNLKVKEGSTFMRQSYPFCSGASGTGFIVSDDGLVATNGHVVTSYKEEEIVGGVIAGNPSMVNFFVNVVQEIVFITEGVVLTEADARVFSVEVAQNPALLNIVLNIMYEMLETNLISVETVSESYFVNVGTKAMEWNIKEINPSSVPTAFKQSDSLFTADLMDFDYGNMYERDILTKEKPLIGSDVALLRLRNPQSYFFPSLKLIQSDSLKEGETITILGYPGIVDGADDILLSRDNSGASVTTTQGLVSSKKRDHGNKLLIQTDASISQGNSGGPAFNTNGEVVGIVTYGFNANSGNYNFLRDTQDLLSLALENDVSLDDQSRVIYTSWVTGLDLFWQNRFTKSLEHFREVQKSYPIHPTVTDVVFAAEESIEAGKDVDFILGIPRTVAYMGIAALAVGVLVALTTLVMTMLKKKLPAPHAVVQAAQPATSELPTQPPVAPVIQPVQPPATQAPNPIETPPPSV